MAKEIIFHLHLTHWETPEAPSIQQHGVGELSSITHAGTPAVVRAVKSTQYVIPPAHVARFDEIAKAVDATITAMLEAE